MVIETEAKTRITPAYAGKRPSRLQRLSGLSDHPRLRGEKRSFPKTGGWGKGSPPLTRGKVKLQHFDGTMLRITPAYAGKSQLPECLRIAIKDHPRLRGEKSGSIAAIMSGLGSPPLTRGKEKQRNANSRTVRITPAYAGKSFSVFDSTPTSWDHPRLRGEKRLQTQTSRLIEGSPPLTRGKAVYGKAGTVSTGITPAYAGKRLNTVAKRSHIICSYPVFYCISFDILPPPFNCSYSLLVISQSFSARCGFIFCQPKYLASVVSW